MCRRILMMVLVASIGLRLTAGAQGIKLGVMGDSLSDEYSDWSDRAYAQNWVEQLVNYREFDCGLTAVATGQPGGTWGDVRGAGYAYNWANPMATSSSLLQQGQHTRLAAQIVANQIRYTVLAIGANNFNSHSEAYARIYEGRWSASRIRHYETGVLANIKTAIATNLLAGARMVLIDLPDYGATPLALSNPLYTDTTKRERVSAVLQNVNQRLADLAQQYQIPMVDWFGLEEAMTGPLTNMHATFLIGNVPIQCQATDPGPGPGSRPTAAFVADGYHPHTTIQAVLANAVLQALNDAYDANVPLFTEEEILDHAGLPYGGADTLPAQIGQYSDYVILPNQISPTGSFTFTFPTNCTNLTVVIDPTGNCWGLTLNIRSRTDPKTAKPGVAASAQLQLPSGDTIVYPEIAVKYPARTGYSLSFKGGTNVTVVPNAMDKKTKVSIKGMKFTRTGTTWNLMAGTISYQFLGQKGRADLMNFVTP